MHFIKELFHYNPIILHVHSLLLASIFFALSISFFCFDKKRFSVLLLFVGSLMLNYFLIHLDPFLNSWDERFHCLVAKHMSINPFNPMLYTQPLLPFDYTNWAGNHIWLHKQPLFLWQMALSIKLFGSSEIAARLPSAIMSSLLAPIVFRMGKLLINARVGFIAALLSVSNNFILEHVAGKQELEHNDLAFMFYVIISFWAWIEYEKTNKQLWLIIAGFFSGASILIKWLPGLLVFSGFGFYHAILKRDLICSSTLSKLTKAVIATLATFLPWQAYILLKYPNEARAEYALNGRHFMEVLQGHGGSKWFYIHELGKEYSMLYPVILLGMLMILLRFRKNFLMLSLLVSTIIIYIFYSAAATKMDSFVMPVAPLCFLFAGVAIDNILTLVSNYKLIAMPLLPIILTWLYLQNLSVDKIAGNHWRNPETYWGQFAQNTADNTTTYKRLNELVPPNSVIAYCNQFEEIDCMFYSGITAYSYLDEKSFKILKTSERKIAVFNNHLPEFVIRDTSVFIIPCDYKINSTSGREN